MWEGEERSRTATTTRPWKARSTSCDHQGEETNEIRTALWASNCSMSELFDINWRLFAIVTLNGMTLASLDFIVASGFSLIVWLMRVVNMAHGSLYLLGAYIGFEVSTTTGSCLMGVAAAPVVVAVAGGVLQISILSWMHGQDLRQALATIGVSIVAADLMLMQWGGSAYQITMPDAVSTFVPGPLSGRYAHGAAHADRVNASDRHRALVDAHPNEARHGDTCGC